MQVQKKIDQLLAEAGFLAFHRTFLQGWDYEVRLGKLKEEGYPTTHDKVDYVTFYSYGSGELVFTCHGPNLRFTMRALAKRFGGRWEKSADSYDFKLEREVDPYLRVVISGDREAVCRKVIVRSTFVEVPAKEAVPATTKQVDEVEWDCGTLMDGIGGGQSFPAGPADESTTEGGW